MRRLRNEMEAAGIPIENSKGECGPGPGGDQRPLRRSLDMADRHVILKNGAKEIAGQMGKAITFMAKYNYGLAGNSSHIHNSLWSADRQDAAVLRQEGPMGPVQLIGQQWAAGQLKYATEYHLVPGALHQFLQALPGRAPSRRPRSSGATTTAPPASACAAKAPRACAWSAASAAPTSIPIWPSRR